MQADDAASAATMAFDMLKIPADGLAVGKKKGRKEGRRREGKKEIEREKE